MWQGPRDLPATAGSRLAHWDTLHLRGHEKPHGAAAPAFQARSRGPPGCWLVDPCGLPRCLAGAPGGALVPPPQPEAVPLPPGDRWRVRAGRTLPACATEPTLAARLPQAPEAEPLRRPAPEGDSAPLHLCPPGLSGQENADDGDDEQASLHNVCATDEAHSDPATAEGQDLVKKKKYLRPCKGKRDRYNRAVARMQAMIEEDPYAFDPGDVELPCWVQTNPELKAKFLARLYRMKEQVEEASLVSL